MRNPWRLLPLRSFSRSPIQIPTSPSQSLANHSRHQNLLTSHLLSPFLPHLNLPNPSICSFSSESAALDPNIHDHPLIDIFSKSNGPGELDSSNLHLDHDTILSALRALRDSPETSLRLFDWVLETHDGKLSSKSYNWMLGNLGRRDYLSRFWDLLAIMKKKGYGVSKGAFERVSNRFASEGLVDDLERLREVYDPRLADDSVETICSKVCDVIRENEWGGGAEVKLAEMGVVFGGDLVSVVSDKLQFNPTKAVMFAKWVVGSPSIKGDARAYNALAGVLGREDCVREFWGIVDEMRETGCRMEVGTYVKVYQRFLKRKMMNDAVELYEFIIGGCSGTPPVQDGLFLLRKIASRNDLDSDLFSRVLRAYKRVEGLPESLFNGVRKSLIGAGKLEERETVCRALFEQVRDESKSSMEKQSSGLVLVRSLCLAGDVDEASSSFRNLVREKGVSGAGLTFNKLLRALCRMGRANDAHKLLLEMTGEKQLKPSFHAYKILINKLLAGGCLKEATNVLGLMRSHGYKPFVEPFICHVAKSGTADDAMTVLQAMSAKRFPPKSVFLHMFKAFFGANRHDAAHNFLSTSPRAIRNHADVLDLFYSMKDRVPESAELAAS